MDLLALFRMLGGLGVVLGLLAGALWVVRRYDVKLPGRVAAGPLRRIELVERLPLDGRRSVALIRRDGREHLILLSPEGPLVVETGIIRDDADAAAAAVRAEAQAAQLAAAEANAAALRESFAGMVEKASGTLRAVRLPAPLQPKSSDEVKPLNEVRPSSTTEPANKARHSRIARPYNKKRAADA